MAVIAQRLVPAEAAGVLFTRDPVSGGDGRFIVNAAFGLGAQAPPSGPAPGGLPPTEPPAGEGGGAPASEGDRVTARLVC